MDESEMKKLLVITDMYPDAANPISGIFVWHQVKELAKRYQVKVVASYFPAPCHEQYSEDSGYPLHYIYFPQPKFFPLTVLTYRRCVLPKVQQLIQDWQPDLIHVHDCRHLPELYVLSHILNGFAGKAFLTVHNAKTLPEKAGRFYLKPFYALSLKSAYSVYDHIFCVNDRLRLRLAPLSGEKRISTLGNAISAFNPVELPSYLTDWLQEGNYKLLSVGNLVATKGFDLLLRAVDELERGGHKLQLLIIGSGAEHGRLIRLRDRLGLSGAVRIEAAQPNDVVRSLYHHFDAFVLPSFSETFGIVYLEAMSSGVPVIGVKGQGIDGVAHDGVTALFCEPRSVKDLVSKIRLLIQNPGLAARIATKGKALADKEFRLEDLIQKLIEHYEA